MWLCTVGSGLWASCQIKVQTADKTLHLHCESGKTLAEQELNFETLPQDAAGEVALCGNGAYPIYPRLHMAI